MSSLLKDAAERVVATFIEAFAGVLILGDQLNLSTAQAAGTAGLIAALTVVKSTAASFIGNKNSASVLPSQPPPTP
jgi:hypothetical protein